MYKITKEYIKKKKKHAKKVIKAFIGFSMYVDYMT